MIMKVEALEHTSIRGRTLYYLRFKKGARELIINVGEGTVKAIKEMEAEDEKEPATDAAGQEQDLPVSNGAKAEGTVDDTTQVRRRRNG